MNWWLRVVHSTSFETNVDINYLILCLLRERINFYSITSEDSIELYATDGHPVDWFYIAIVQLRSFPPSNWTVNWSSLIRSAEAILNQFSLSSLALHRIQIETLTLSSRHHTLAHNVWEDSLTPLSGWQDGDSSWIIQRSSSGCRKQATELI